MTGNAEYVAQWAARTDLSYTVKYLEQGTNVELADAKTVTGQTFGAEVTENAIDIEGYAQVAPISAKITIAVENADIIFYYFKKDTTVDIQKAVTQVGDVTNLEYDANGKLLTKAKVGDTIQWTITVTNKGNVAQTLTLEDILSNGKNVTITKDGQAFTGGFTLAAKGTVTFKAAYVVQLADAGEELVNTAVIKDGDKKKGEDPAPGVTVEPALNVTKTVEAGKKNTVEVGDTIEYTIVVENTSKITLTDITVKEDFGGDIDKIKLDLPKGVEKIDADEYLIASLDAGEKVEITFTYRVRSADVGTLTNKVTVESTYDGKKVTDEDKSPDVTVERDHYRPSVTPSKPTLNYQDHVAYIIGYEDGTVRPQNNITRAEVATIFFRLLSDESREDFWMQYNEYTDVKLTAWYNNAVSTLSNAGIITGYPDGTFRPDAPITRAEFAAIAARFSEVIYNGGNSFTDVPENHWAARFIALAEHLGWITGYPDGTFKPNQAITRAEAMTLINRVLERAVEEKHMLPDMVTWVDSTPDDWFYEAVQEATNSHEYLRLDKLVRGQDFNYEDWTEILEVPDWAALENAWSTVNSK